MPSTAHVHCDMDSTGSAGIVAGDMITLGVNDLAYLAQVRTTDWARRVVANGGAFPSQNTINAMETLRLGVIAAGLDTSISSMLVLVPDSAIAASTPLFVGIGLDPWTNHGFVDGDLTVEGMKGNGSSKYLDSGITGVFGINPVSGDCGLIALVTESNSNAQCTELGVHLDIGNPPSGFQLNASSLLNPATNPQQSCFGAGTIPTVLLLLQAHTQATLAV